MHLDDSGEDFTDFDAEMGIEDAQNPPTSAPDGLANSRLTPAIQETQEEDTQAEMEEPEPKWDRTWDVLDFYSIMEQGIKTLHESNANKKQKERTTAVIGALYEAIKGELCTDPNFPIQGDSFQYDTWMAMQSNHAIRLQASGIMTAGQAAFETAQENLLLGTLTRLRKVEDQIVTLKVHVGAGTFEEENRVKNLQKKELNNKMLKEGEQKLFHQCKKADENGSEVAKKREETD